MFPLKSNIDISSAKFQKKHKEYSKIVEKLHLKLNEVYNRFDQPSIEKFQKKGKLLARERINKLIDENTPFLEFSQLAANDKFNNGFPSAGIITGIGQINNKKAVIIANDATVKGGTYIAGTIKKHIRAQQIALENNLPCVYLVDSGGVFLPEQANVFPDRLDFGRIFYNQARLSANGIPQISIVMGSCTAGGAYVPAMSDETIIVEKQGTIFLGGPPLVKAATGEVVTAEELGGAEVHTKYSGVADHIALNDEHALQLCRNIFETLPWHANDDLQFEIEEPKFPLSELYGILSTDLKESIDAYEVIMRIADGSKFHEFKAEYGKTLVTGFTKVMGFDVGIIANNGILFSESSLKGTHFIQLCEHRRLPILFFQNISGFMIGKEYEHGGIAKDGAKFVNAVANVNVPKITVIIGGSFGAGNYAMAGRAYDPRFLFMFPNARISVMGGEQAANVLVTVKEEQLKAAGKTMNEDDKTKIREEILSKYEYESSAYFSTSNLWDDGIIDPLDVRKVLGMAISVSLNNISSENKYGIFRM